MPTGVDFISVHTASDEIRPNYPPNLWLKDEGWPVPLIVDDEAGTVSNAFGLSAFPFWVAVGGDGAILFRQAGAISTADFENFAEAVAGS